MKKKHPFPFDYSIKHANYVVPEHVVEYLDIGTVFKESLPTVKVKENAEETRNDYVFHVDLIEDKFNWDLSKNSFNEAIVVFEHQSTPVDNKRLIAMAFDLCHYAVKYHLPVLLVILTDEESYKRSVKKINIGNICLEPIYRYNSLEEIRQKLNTLNNKIISRENLNRDEILDLGFLPIISPKDYRPKITKNCADMFKQISIDDDKLDNAVRFCLAMMVREFLPAYEIKSFYEVIGMLSYEEGLKRFAEDVAEERTVELREENDRLKEEIENLRKIISDLTK